MTQVRIALCASVPTLLPLLFAKEGLISASLFIIPYLALFLLSFSQRASIRRVVSGCVIALGAIVVVNPLLIFWSLMSVVHFTDESSLASYIFLLAVPVHLWLMIAGIRVLRRAR